MNGQEKMDINTDSCGDSDSEDGLSTSKKAELSEFDIIIGHIEDILVDDDFEHLQKDFLEKYWEEFENKEENKLIYMNIFKEYTNLIENHLEEKLKVKVPEFCMKRFTQTLMDKKNDLEGEVFEMLYTFSDFLSFKEMVLDYRAMKEGAFVDFSRDLHITPLQNLPSEPKKSI
uniref:ADP-ribosylation factor-like protein 2-binding protein n=1 Tax=Graphocephala atropunctata TaxID=36148 RepID=A0A1B6KEY4_9HEMI